jgi:hypothetical protein
MSARSRARSGKYGASRAIGEAANNLLFSLPTISHWRQIITMAWKWLYNDGMEVALPALP